MSKILGRHKATVTITLYDPLTRVNASIFTCGLWPSHNHRAGGNFSSHITEVISSEWAAGSCTIITRGVASCREYTGYTSGMFATSSACTSTPLLLPRSVTNSKMYLKFYIYVCWAFNKTLSSNSHLYVLTEWVQKLVPQHRHLTQIFADHGNIGPTLDIKPITYYQFRTRFPPIPLFYYFWRIVVTLPHFYGVWIFSLWLMWSATADTTNHILWPIFVEPTQIHGNNHHKLTMDAHRK